MAAQSITKAFEEITAADLAHCKRFSKEIARLKRSLLTIDEMAEIYKTSVATIRTKLSRNTFRPLPIEKYPYRWRLSDVEADLKRPRTKLLTRRHGFAAVKAKRAEADDE